MDKTKTYWFRNDDSLEAKLGYAFENPELLARALFHRSYIFDRGEPGYKSNERLEFLGDSVLNMLTTEYLYRTFPELSEGELSVRKAAIVSGHACAQTAKRWELGNFVRIGKNELKNGVRNKESVAADAFEAVLGALYLDGGLDEVRKVLQAFHFSRIEEILSADDFVNHKNELLEYMQARGAFFPEYRILEESGPEHIKVFHVGVFFNGELLGAGEGSSKKKAEQAASRSAMHAIKSGTLKNLEKLFDEALSSEEKNLTPEKNSVKEKNSIEEAALKIEGEQILEKENSNGETTSPDFPNEKLDGKKISENEIGE